MTKYYKIVDFIPGVSAKEQSHYLGKYTGEKRPPKKGEWYLSGAIPEVYRAPNDLPTMSFHIMQIVKVEIDLVITEVGVYED